MNNKPTAIVIREITSYDTVDEFEKVIKSLALTERITKAEIHYNTAIGLPGYDCPIEQYPVILSTDIGITINLLTLTAGYSGSGPTDLLKVLRLSGFDVEDDTITAKRKNGIVDIILTK